MEWDRLQAPSPRENMHSELLMQRNRHEIDIGDRTGAAQFEFAAWLKLKNTDDLPVMLLLEYTDSRSTRWHIIDTARVRNIKGASLLSGRAEIEVKRLQELKLYICHPSPKLIVEVDELRFNGDLVRKDFIDAFSVA